MQVLWSEPAAGMGHRCCKLYNCLQCLDKTSESALAKEKELSIELANIRDEVAFNTAKCEKLQKEKEALERRFEEELRRLGWQQQAEVQELQERLQQQFEAESARLQAEHQDQLLRMRCQHQEQGCLVGKLAASSVEEPSIPSLWMAAEDRQQWPEGALSKVPAR